MIESGGTLTLQHAQISGAKYGMFAMPGSTFSVDHALIDTSFKAAVGIGGQLHAHHVQGRAAVPRRNRRSHGRMIRTVV